MSKQSMVAAIAPVAVALVAAAVGGVVVASPAHSAERTVAIHTLAGATTQTWPPPDPQQA